MTDIWSISTGSNYTWQR